MGAGAPGIEGLSSGTKRIEEARTNSMGGLTSGGRRRRRPEFEVIATGGTGRLGLAAASGSARAATQQGEER
jgi:hypothetical protein